jgi:hypothetical protein
MDNTQQRVPSDPKPAFKFATVLTMPFAILPGGQPGEIMSTALTRARLAPSMVQLALSDEVGGDMRESGAGIIIDQYPRRAQ